MSLITKYEPRTSAALAALEPQERVRYSRAREVAGLVFTEILAPGLLQGFVSFKLGNRFLMERYEISYRQATEVKALLRAAGILECTDKAIKDKEVARWRVLPAFYRDRVRAPRTRSELWWAWQASMPKAEADARFVAAFVECKRQGKRATAAAMLRADEALGWSPC